MMRLDPNLLVSKADKPTISRVAKGRANEAEVPVELQTCSQAGNGDPGAWSQRDANGRVERARVWVNTHKGGLGGDGV